MNVTIDKAIEENPELVGLVRHANTALAAVVGESSSRLKGHWSPELNGDSHVVLRLHLDDGVGSSSADFATEELRNPDSIVGRMMRLWRAVLRDRSNKQAKRLRELVAALPEE